MTTRTMFTTLRLPLSLPAAFAGLAVCGEAKAAPPEAPAEEGAPPAEHDFTFLDELSRRGTMLGDKGGLRPWLAGRGITFTLQETSEALGNVSGGLRRGFDYDGLTTGGLQLDTERAFGWHGGSFNVSALQFHGRNLSADNLASLQTASGIEADRATRLWELCYQQKFLDEDRLDVKLGRQSLDQEFMVSQNAAYFVNTMFGWPMLPSADMPGGGPAYPLSALGVRLRVRPSDAVTVLAGVFNGSPAPNRPGDPQKANAAGVSFPVDGSALAIAEIQYAYPNVSTLVQADQPEPMPRSYKLGVWYDSKRFNDLRFDATGRSLADPASTGTPRGRDGNYAFYGVADQMVWRDDEELDRTLNVFLRAMGTPDEDRNLIDFSLNAGITLHEPLPHRDEDTFGLGLGFTQVGGHASALDRDIGAFSGSYYPVRGSETFIEATYQIQLAPWWQLQPDVQYVFNPGGGAPNPADPAARLGDEFIPGVRTNILF